jgi:hypothetical protein
MLSSGRALTYIQRMTSTPIRSAASSNSIALPQLLCIGGRPRRRAWRAEDRLERLLAAEDRRHREHRVEPVRNWPGKLSVTKSAGNQFAQYAGSSR